MSSSTPDKKFIAVVPDREHIISGIENIDYYLYTTIVSGPCRSLLDELDRIMSKTKIAGIFARGSLAKFLYESDIPLTIYELKYDLSNILSGLRECFGRKYKRVCIMEVSFESDRKLKDSSCQVTMGEYEITYCKIYDTSCIDDTVRNLMKSNKIDVLMGDDEPVQTAQKYGIPCIDIIIDEKSYLNTIAQAKHAFEIATTERFKNNFIEIITNIITEGVIIIDKAGNIKRYNQSAEKMLSISRHTTNVQDIFHKEISTILQYSANTVVEADKKNYVLNPIPLILDDTRLYAIVVNTVKYVESLELSIRKQNKERGLTAKSTFNDIVCEDPKSKKIVEISKRYSKSNGTVIIYGETGTGKEVYASSIHNESPRADGPFVAINCANFNETLIESELFGYEKGAFTGALNSGKIGMFELAHRGTIFLDEIGELPLNMQAKLLRVIQEKEIIRIGGSKVIPVDFRIIAATNKDLGQMINQNLFREDLYYRLSLLEIKLLPLRERPLDIVPLLINFLVKAMDSENRSYYWDDPSVFDSVTMYDWPGNVRELRNFAERLILLTDSNKITKELIDDMLSQKFTVNNSPKYTTNITDDLKALESDYINFLLKKFGNNKDKLCEFLNISKPTLWRKLNKQ